MKIFEMFNYSPFGCWINSPSGRFFRLSAGIAFLAAGLFLWPATTGMALLGWSIIPLIAGVFNVCWVSLVLGGPFSSDQINRDRKSRENS